ncbi:hypothetical protein LIPSTDRAFT_335606, partial [Lipomyces starkeyi NRRL Y-11557]
YSYSYDILFGGVSDFQSPLGRAGAIAWVKKTSHGLKDTYLMYLLAQPMQISPSIQIRSVSLSIRHSTSISAMTVVSCPVLQPLDSSSSPSSCLRRDLQ